MKVIYLIEIELKTWRPYRILCLIKEYGAFAPSSKDLPIQVTESRIVTTRDYLYNAVADEYLVKLWAVSAQDEEKGAAILKEFTGCGWEEVAAHVGGTWLYLQKQWFVPESLKCGATTDVPKEIVRKNEEEAGEEGDRLTLEEAGVRTEAQTG